MNNFEIQNLFPTGVVCSQTRYKFSKNELDFVNGFKSDLKLMPGNARSHDRYVLQSPSMNKISKFINEGIKFYVDNIIMPQEKLEFYITQSWLNYTDPGQDHGFHNHHNSIISGVLYINADPAQDKIHFYNPKNDKYDRLKIVPEQWNHYNSQSWWLPTGTGQLILFDSSVHHSVETTTSTDTRISLAFNTFVKGYLGNEDALTALHLK